MLGAIILLTVPPPPDTVPVKALMLALNEPPVIDFPSTQSFASGLPVFREKKVFPAVVTTEVILRPLSLSFSITIHGEVPPRFRMTVKYSPALSGTGEARFTV